MDRDHSQLEIHFDPGLVSEFVGGSVSADQQLVIAGAGVGEVADSPIVEAIPLGSASAGSCCHRPGTFLVRVSARNFLSFTTDSCEQATART